MDMNGEYLIAASRDRVWAALNDPDILQQCVSGCEEMVRQSEVEFTAKARIKVGPVNARFSGKVVLSEIDAPHGYTITGQGDGGAAGFGRGGARVTLHEDGPDRTRLCYTAQAQVGGKLAQIGSRLVQSTAKKMADDFFAQFSVLLNGGTQTADFDQATDAVATELLVEAAEEIEATPVVPSSAMPQFASVPLTSRPGYDPDSAAALADLAEPHHSLDEPEQRGTAPAMAPVKTDGIRPLVWIPLLALALLAIAVLVR